MKTHQPLPSSLLQSPLVDTHVTTPPPAIITPTVTPALLVGTPVTTPPPAIITHTVTPAPHIVIPLN